VVHPRISRTHQTISAFRRSLQLETPRLWVRPQPSGLSSNPKKPRAESRVSPFNAGRLLTGGLRALAEQCVFRKLLHHPYRSNYNMVRGRLRRAIHASCDVNTQHAIRALARNRHPNAKCPRKEMALKTHVFPGSAGTCSSNRPQPSQV
jgi:hypothetical protein